jgi:hypothetical protein
MGPEYGEKYRYFSLECGTKRLGEVISPQHGVWYGSSWLGSDGSAATRTNPEPARHCEAGARASRPANDALRAWSEGAGGRFPHTMEARFEAKALPRRWQPELP